MKTVYDIKITNEHTFNNWGTFDIVHEGKTYFAKWQKHGNEKELVTEAPQEVYKRVYNYLFDENI